LHSKGKNNKKTDKPEIRIESEKFGAKVEKTRNFDRVDTVSSSTIKKGLDNSLPVNKETKKNS
jgi:hypothetical protein